MGLKKADLCEVLPEFSYLGSWHANLIYVGGRKCILFVNDKTLFNFIAAGVSRTQIRNLGDMFKNLLQCVLADECFEISVIEKIMSEYEELRYAKTVNRSVLGSMNDLAFNYKYYIHDAGGVHSHAVPSIIGKLNRMPLSAIEYVYPIKAVRALF